MTSDELRAAFLSFFESQGHKIIPSSSLIPHDDPTLLLTSAGMVQFKPYFLGEAAPPGPRLASCQKCFRTTDIEVVGDPTHLTFFEMLGNFSIGDYFKKEAIAWAWDFVIEKLKLPPERLWVTVYLDDEESFGYWRQLGVPEKRILRMGEDTNFWGPAGDSGPCGPCSEIHYDFGEQVGCHKPDCRPGCDCGRYSEIWNLVFTQYNQDKDGKRTPLPRPNIDTGMGLERTAAILQGKNTVYETDLFVPLLRTVSEITGRKYGTDNDSDNAMRIIAEHSRGIAFLIADGVLPSNEGRGYVLRRLLRRAALFGRRLGLERPFLSETARTTMKLMGRIYPELVQRRDFILKVIELEETRFNETLSTGLELEDELISIKGEDRKKLDVVSSKNENDFKNKPGQPVVNIVASNVAPFQFSGDISSRVNELISDMKRLPVPEQQRLYQEEWPKVYDATQIISAQDAFRLYDTYGFPVELTREIAKGRGFSIDLAGFEKEMEKQRARGRKVAISDTLGLSTKVVVAKGLAIKPTRFVGYNDIKQKTTILNILVNNDLVSEVKEGQAASLILESTPFYGEMGGQVGDTGEIRSGTSRFEVTSTVRMPQDIIVHQGKVTQGSLRIGDEVEAEVDMARRLDIARNHTATHLLQAALRQVLGEHIQQRGSLVAPERLRFDFSHLLPLTREEIRKVSRVVNDRIRQNLIVRDEEIPYKQATAEGVIALFDEKYGDTVRVLRVGQPPISAELCGGTHVTTTGEIGFFHIISESSIGAGLRRIEAVTGRGSEAYVEKRLADLEKIAQYLETEPDRILEKAESVSAELKEEHKRTLALEKELAKRSVEPLLKKSEEVMGIKVVAARVEDNTRIDTLREMSDLVKDELGKSIVVLATVWQDKPNFVANVAPSLVKEGYDAREIIKKVAKVTGGGGGGKRNIAQGGGRFKDKIDEALQKVPDLIKKSKGK